MKGLVSSWFGGIVDMISRYTGSSHVPFGRVLSSGILKLSWKQMVLVSSPLGLWLMEMT